MRVVRERAALRDAIEGAQREAKSAFGDSALLIERYFEDVRHIEVQIIGDTQGNVVHCFERECSIQRRHQKVIEVFTHLVLPSLLFFLFRSPFMSSPFINTSSGNTINSNHRYSATPDWAVRSGYWQVAEIRGAGDCGVHLRQRLFSILFSGSQYTLAGMISMSIPLLSFFAFLFLFFLSASGPSIPAALDSLIFIF